MPSVLVIAAMPALSMPMPRRLRIWKLETIVAYVAAALSVMLLARVASAAVVFTSLAADGSYDSGTGRGINGSAWMYGYAAEADQFMPSASGTLSSIELGLHYALFSSAAGDQVDVRLALDVNDPLSGHIPSATSLTAGTLTLNTSFGYSDLLTFTPTNVVSLTAGTPYWVVILPHFTTTVADWNANSIGKSGPVAISLNGSSWLQNPIEPMDAFRVNTVPEPSTYSLVLLGLAGALKLRRCKRL